MSKTNADRIESVNIILPKTDTWGDKRNSLVDLLTNMMHFASHHSMAWTSIQQSAELNFNGETGAGDDIEQNERAARTCAALEAEIEAGQKLLRETAKTEAPESTESHDGKPMLTEFGHKRLGHHRRCLFHINGSTVTRFAQPMPECNLGGDTYCRFLQWEDDGPGTQLHIEPDHILEVGRWHEKQAKAWVPCNVLNSDIPF